tara:strand:- start:218 stop:1465 length:1248 start_codon:yes stop_codon:yes gene_type:complete
MPNKNKLILVESEMKGPKGHFLDNLIETTLTFEKKLDISWLLNKRFDNEGTYIPNNIKIFKCISGNIFNRKSDKFLYLIEEIYLVFLNIFQICYMLFYFLKENNLFNYFIALKSNYFLLPKYFFSFYKRYKMLNLSKNDHIFFQTARRKDIALINFLTKIDKKHPKFHIRVMLPPKIKFKGFFYFLREIDNVFKEKRAFIYLWSDHNYKLFLKNSISKKGICKSNIPWSFYKRKLKTKKHIIGFVGDARKARGFHHLPEIIKILQKKKYFFKYIIQFSKISDDLLDVKSKLYKLSKYNDIKIIEKYCDYKDFRNILKKIDIMPIIHNSNEINKVTSGTMYSCISNEIPLVIPSGTLFMDKILKYKSFEKAKNLSEFADKLIMISKKYNFYLKNVKKNSNILKSILKNDPLRVNII